MCTLYVCMYVITNVVCPRTHVTTVRQMPIKWALQGKLHLIINGFIVVSYIQQNKKMMN